MSLKTRRVLFLVDQELHDRERKLLAGGAAVTVAVGWCHYSSGRVGHSTAAVQPEEADRLPVFGQVADERFSAIEIFNFVHRREKIIYSKFNKFPTNFPETETPAANALFCICVCFHSGRCEIF